MLIFKKLYLIIGMKSMYLITIYYVYIKLQSSPYLRWSGLLYLVQTSEDTCGI